MKKPLGLDFTRATIYAQYLGKSYQEAHSYAPDFLATSNLVSSRIIEKETRYATEYHAPTLDLDFPAAITQVNGKQTLWLDLKRINKSRWHRVLSTLAHHQILDPSRHTSVKLSSPSAYKKRYAKECFFALDSSAQKSAMVNLGPSFSGDFEDLTALTSIFTETTTGPRMLNPHPIPLGTAATLLKSTTNNHLYLDALLKEEDYFKLLDDLVAAKILQPAYVRASKANRKSTCLRLPWIVKDYTKKNVIASRP